MIVPSHSDRQCRSGPVGGGVLPLLALPLLALALLVLGVACDEAPGAGPGSGSAASKPAASVSAARVAVDRVRPGDLDDRWRFLGEVEPHQQARLAAGASGEVREVRVRVGDQVRKGQRLLRIDTALAAARLSLAEADHHRGTTQLAQAERERKRSERLGDLVVAPAQLEQEQAHAATAEAQLRGFEASAREARAQLARHRVVAPFDGVVAARRVDPGDWVDPGAPVLDIVEVGRVQILVRVTPELIDFVAVGSSAQVYQGKHQVEARIAGVVPALGERSRTATVRIELDERPSWLLPGSAVSVEFPVRRSGEGVIVSRDALVVAPTQTRVMKVVEDHVEPVIVEVIATAGMEALVRSDALAVDDQVVVRGNERLKPGQAIQIVGATGEDLPPRG